MSTKRQHWLQQLLAEFETFTHYPHCWVEPKNEDWQSTWSKLLPYVMDSMNEKQPTENTNTQPASKTTPKTTAKATAKTTAKMPPKTNSALVTPALTQPKAVESQPKMLVEQPATRLANIQQAQNLTSLQVKITGCTQCRLSENRQHIVFGQGAVSPQVVFVGEGPGKDEDLQGLAFVGRSGKLLILMLAAIGLSRQAVYITNVVKCRPPANRQPEKAEVQTCAPILERQLALLRPKIIITLGNVALHYFLPKAPGIVKARQTFYEYEGTPLLPMFHPAYLLRNRKVFGEAWQDYKTLKDFLIKHPPDL